ncbi:hypothetical protein NDK25_04845 [Niallia taxi]|nr:hypothetical protein [Niallia taxi]
MALFKGNEFVCSNIFDDIRTTIIEGSNVENFLSTGNYLGKMQQENFVENFPAKSHYVIIIARDLKITAFVSFYSEALIKIKLTDRNKGESFTYGFVCDWQNKKE